MIADCYTHLAHVYRMRQTTMNRGACKLPYQPNATLRTSVSQALRGAIDYGLEPVEVDLLLLLALSDPQVGRAWLRANLDYMLTSMHEKRFAAFCQRRLNGEPLAYITGHRGFYGLDLHVDSRVLDPRPDTETLVDWALDVIRLTQQPRVVDLGTGSGAIAFALQHNRPDAQVVAVDASADALAVASSNATRLQLPVRFVQGSWLTPFDASLRSDCRESQIHAAIHAEASTFDLIVSNPPYIADGDSHLPALTHEPIQALTSGPDGLDAIRQIIAQSPDCLKRGGWLLLEHGYDQAEAVTALLQAQGFQNVQSRNDLAGITRCTGGQKPIPGDRG